MMGLVAAMSFMTVPGRLISEEFVEQAQVTNWPARIAWTALVIGVIALVLWAMRRGWKARVQRQSDVPAPAAPTAEPMEEAIPGLYLGTSVSGDWLDRIAAHGLGVRSRALVDWSESGVAMHRQGAPSLVIPAADILGVRADSGVAATVRSKDSVVVITWQLGERVVDTGFRADDASGHRTVLDGLMDTFLREAGA
jgi:hypothetical protein